MSVESEMDRWRAAQDRKRLAAGFPTSMDPTCFPDEVREKAIEAHAEASRLGMLRVGNPWVPIAAAIHSGSRAQSRIDELSRHIIDLQKAIVDLVTLERMQTPDMSGRRRTHASMQNGTELADALDRARNLLAKTV